MLNHNSVSIGVNLDKIYDKTSIGDTVCFAN